MCHETLEDRAFHQDGPSTYGIGPGTDDVELMTGYPAEGRVIQMHQWLAECWLTLIALPSSHQMCWLQHIAKGKMQKGLLRSVVTCHAYVSHNKMREKR